MAEGGNAGALQLLWSPRQSKSSGYIPNADTTQLATCSTWAEPESSVSYLGAHEETDKDLVTLRKSSTSISESTFLRLTRGRSRMQ